MGFFNKQICFRYFSYTLHNFNKRNSISFFAPFYILFLSGIIAFSLNGLGKIIQFFKIKR